MLVRSTVDIGFRQNGDVFLVKGDNDVAEPLTDGEKELLDALVHEKIVEIIAPPSDAKVAPAAAPPPRRRSTSKRT